jgi:hypothetical protein
MINRLATPALLLAGLLVFAACGGDDDDDSNASGSTDTTARSSRTTQAAEDATDDTTADDATDTTIDFSGKGSKEFCNFAKDKLNDFNDVDFSGSSGDLEQQLGDFKKALDDLADRAPSEIEADVRVMGEVIDKLDEFYAQFDYDPTKLQEAATKDPQKLAQFTELLSDPKFEEASTRLSAYSEQECGITE